MVFLTGVTGFLGGAFLSQVLESPFDGEVVCLVRADDDESADERVRRSIGRFGSKDLLPKNVKILRGDLLSDAWHQSPKLSGVTHVMHLAASTSFGNSRGIRKTNVEGALSLATAMRGRNLERFIYTGTAAICGASPSPIVHEDDYPNERAQHLVAYTRSKAEAERLLSEQFADLPLVVARPSIVVGHTELGCKPSGSIFWVLRAVEALRFITWDLENRIDVVPVDWAADALTHLLFAPRLKHNRYHVSAGTGASVRWKELAEEYARLRGGSSRDRYEVGGMRQLTATRVMQAAGEGHPRHLLHALELYYRFCSLDLVYDNCRLLKEGVPAPPRFTDYMRVCEESSTSSIYDQMRSDLELSLTLA
ncbi:MAG TPA: SDR family oxidoreductase [Bryobacteraceae bacterium]|nr:SDR family oxidoreductase [Bryobacteraceae bacterium]